MKNLFDLNQWRYSDKDIFNEKIELESSKYPDYSLEEIELLTHFNDRNLSITKSINDRIIFSEYATSAKLFLESRKLYITSREGGFIIADIVSIKKSTHNQMIIVDNNGYKYTITVRVFNL